MSFDTMLKKGGVGESRVENLLKKLQESLPLKYIRNVKITEVSKALMPKRTQIDFIVFTPQGMLVLEVKNWDSTIEVVSDNWWRVYRQSGEAISIHSPLKQNEYHCKVLHSNFNIDCYNLVVFMDKSNIVGDKSGIFDLLELSDYIQNAFLMDEKYPLKLLSDIHFYLNFSGDFY